MTVQEYIEWKNSKDYLDKKDKAIDVLEYARENCNSFNASYAKEIMGEVIKVLREFE